MNWALPWSEEAKVTPRDFITSSLHGIDVDCTLVASEEFERLCRTCSDQ